jgi:hypothetical protein
MKKLIHASLLAASSLLPNAYAIEVTTLPDGVLLHMPELNYVGIGPQALGSNIVWSSDTSYSVFGYTVDYYFGMNGAWSGMPMVGVNSSDNTMTFTFAQPVFGFGGFMNFGPNFSNARIAVYDIHNNLIESAALSFHTDSSHNSGEFHGFRENTASIKSFTMSGAYIGGANFRVQAVPEPETYAFMLAGLAGLGLMARRRKA